jgi:hypothetical protein
METIEFERMDGSNGRTLEYRDAFGHTIAYVDYSADKVTAGCTVFDPYTGHAREYSVRVADRAEAIVARHLAKLGL